MRCPSICAAVAISLLAVIFQSNAAPADRNVVVTIWVEREPDSTTVKSYEIMTTDGGPKTTLDATERVPLGGGSQASGVPMVAMALQTVGFKGQFAAQTAENGLIRVDGDVSDIRLPAPNGAMKSFHHSFQVLLKDGVAQEVLKFDDPNAGRAVLKVRAVAQVTQKQAQ